MRHWLFFLRQALMVATFSTLCSSQSPPLSRKVFTPDSASIPAPVKNTIFLFIFYFFFPSCIFYILASIFLYYLCFLYHFYYPLVLFLFFPLSYHSCFSFSFHLFCLLFSLIIYDLVVFRFFFYFSILGVLFQFFSDAFFLVFRQTEYILYFHFHLDYNLVHC